MPRRRPIPPSRCDGERNRGNEDRSHNSIAIVWRHGALQRHRSTGALCAWLRHSVCPALWSQAELDAILADYVGRETPLYYAERLSEHYKR